MQNLKEVKSLNTKWKTKNKFLIQLKYNLFTNKGMLTFIILFSIILLATIGLSILCNILLNNDFKYSVQAGISEEEAVLKTRDLADSMFPDFVLKIFKITFGVLVFSLFVSLFLKTIVYGVEEKKYRLFIYGGVNKKTIYLNNIIYLAIFTLITILLTIFLILLVFKFTDLVWKWNLLSYFDGDFKKAVILKVLWAFSSGMLFSIVFSYLEKYGWLKIIIWIAYFVVIYFFGILLYSGVTKDIYGIAKVRIENYVYTILILPLSGLGSVKWVTLTDYTFYLGLLLNIAYSLIWIVLMFFRNKKLPY